MVNNKLILSQLERLAEAQDKFGLPMRVVMPTDFHAILAAVKRWIKIEDALDQIRNEASSKAFMSQKGSDIENYCTRFVRIATEAKEQDAVAKQCEHETIDVTKPEQMIGSLWMWFDDGVLYECKRHDSETGNYEFIGVADDGKKMSCLYSFLPVKMWFVRGARHGK